MSWTGGLFVFPEKTSKENMMIEIIDQLDENRGKREPVHLPIVLLDHEVFKSYEEAEEYLDSDELTRMYSRRKNYGVRFLSYDNVKPSKKVEELRRRIDETYVKSVEYGKMHSVKNFKSTYVGCPKCGSRLKADLVFGDRCPLCHTDLRSETTLKTLARYKEKINELKKRELEEVKKAEAKADVCWLIHADAYIG